MRIRCFEAMTIALLAAACNVDVATTMTTAGSTTGDGSTTGTTGATTTTTGVSTTTTGPTTGMSGTATSSPATSEPGTSEPGTSEPGTSEPGTTEPGTTEPGTTEPDTSGSTGEPPGESTGMPPGDCAGLGPQQCMNNQACMPIFGQKINTQKMCLQKAMFLECADAKGCGDALTIGCPMGTMEQYQFPDTCLPSDFEPCDGKLLEQSC